MHCSLVTYTAGHTLKIASQLLQEAWHQLWGLLWWFWYSVAGFLLGTARKRTVLWRACPLFCGIWALSSGGSLFVGGSERLAVSAGACSGSREGCLAAGKAALQRRTLTGRWQKYCDSKCSQKKVLEQQKPISLCPWQHVAECSPRAARHRFPSALALSAGSSSPRQPRAFGATFTIGPSLGRAAPAGQAAAWSPINKT